MPRTILAAIAVLAIWAASLLIKPFGKCWLCRGRRVRIVKGRRKAKTCWACKGAGRRQRIGSRTVYRIRRSAVAGWQSRTNGGE